VERLSEQQSCRAEETVKEDSAESRTMEAMVLVAPAACDSAVRVDCALGFLFLLDGHGDAAGPAVARGGGGGKEVSLALPWKRELRASLLVTMAAALLEVQELGGGEVGACLNA